MARSGEGLITGLGLVVKVLYQPWVPTSQLAFVGREGGGGAAEGIKVSSPSLYLRDGPPPPQVRVRGVTCSVLKSTLC